MKSFHFCNNFPSSPPLAVDDRTNETIVPSDGHGESTAASDVILRDILLPLFFLLVVPILLASFALYIILQRPLRMWPHRVQPVPQPEIVIRQYFDSSY